VYALRLDIRGDGVLVLRPSGTVFRRQTNLPFNTIL
jgi:hypothetical protein